PWDMLPGLVTRIPLVLPVLLRRMLDFNHWAIFWPIVPLLLLAGRRALSRPLGRRLLLAAAVPPMIGWAAYSVHHDPVYLATVTWERFLLQGSLPFLLLLACALSEILKTLRAAGQDHTASRPAEAPAAVADHRPAGP
ncbi:MAG: hypothetical protein M3O15_07185, partial [Acidobacteriota bacterium]|nr:hypothetical protein [Acidobacteriota bacterium]